MQSLEVNTLGQGGSGYGLGMEVQGSQAGVTFVLRPSCSRTFHSCHVLRCEWGAEGHNGPSAQALTIMEDPGLEATERAAGARMPYRKGREP